MLYSLRIEVIADTFAKAEEEVDAYERAMIRDIYLERYGVQDPNPTVGTLQTFKVALAREVTDESYHKGEGPHVVGRRKVLYKAHTDTLIREVLSEEDGSNERVAFYKLDRDRDPKSFAVNIHVGDNPERDGKAAGNAFINELNKRKITMNKIVS